MSEIKELGYIEKGTGKHQSNCVYSSDGIAPAVCAVFGVKQPPTMHVEIVAMRGRDRDNPSDRTSGNKNLEQRLEINSGGVCNTLTTVQKDNMVLEMVGYLGDDQKQSQAVYSEDGLSMNITTAHGSGNGWVLVKQATSEGHIPCKIGGVADLSYPSSGTRRGRVIDQGEVSPTLTTENIPSVIEPWTWEIDGVKYLIRIRRLTPKECWRLMNFTDADYQKAADVNSQSQLYKQAGNSIVKNVLVAAFGQLFDGKENKYKEGA